MITIKQQPTGYPSAHGRIDYVVTSDNQATQPNFKYVFDVYVGGVLQSRVKIFPEPGTGLGLFNVSKILRSYLNKNYFFNLGQLITPVYVEGYHQVTYELKIGEEWGDPPTTYLNLVSTGNKRAYNYYDSLVPYTGERGQISHHVAEIASSRPLNERVTMNDQGHFPFFNPDGEFWIMNIRAYNSSGVQINSWSGNIGGQLTQIGFTPDCLNFSVPGLIGATCAYYTIQVGSRTYRFDLDCFSKFPNYSVVFLNQWGGYETAFFRMKSQRAMDVDRKTYGSPEVASFIGGASAGVAYNEQNALGVYRPNQRNFYLTQKQTYKLTTDFLTDQQFEWLGQLIASPVVYLHLVNNGHHYLPVSIKATNYQYLTRAANGLNPLEIELEILQNYNSQIG